MKKLFLGLILFVFLGASNASADNLFRTCLKSLGSLLFTKKSEPAYRYMMFYNKYEFAVLKGSVSEKIGIQMDLTDERVVLPTAVTVNKVLSLDKNSEIFFEEVDSEGNILIENNRYYKMLSKGVVGVTRFKSKRHAEDGFQHDMLHHVVGYYLISKTPNWKIAKNLMADFIFHEEKLSNNSKFHEKTVKLKENLAAALELYSAMISNFDRGELKFYNQYTPENVMFYLTHEITNIQNDWLDLKLQYKK